MSNNPTYLVWVELGIHPDKILASSSADFVNLVISLPMSSNDPAVSRLIREESSIQIDLILDCIWNFRNQVVHTETK